ncbi:FAD-linked oxidase C-terminal domain-containing protein [Curvibacter sp. APW13]|uniref:FAD-binding oxidoreductase n=1 Tax=Curvibacter sp. APW13 TaxID=3077236 RepID=UPI0028DE33E9|nr:FAD-linked oxidase C-terminal domain-containing protein [Curvibacter sp. APW13]MDT8990315.1 FAD-linked oxidase C-terminal domain-containing protein [Curvibacter sp. APW13]
MNAPAMPPDLLPAVTQRPAPTALLQALQERFASQFSAAQAVREQHGRDESAFDIPPPAAVVFAENTQDIADCVALCAQHRYPVIPFGVGSSLEGHLLAIEGGISLDVSRMNAVLAIHPEDLTATVQPGVTRTQLNAALKDHGLFFPIDPGADASIGGMSATRASGTNAVRYGTMRENVLALEVVTAAGEVIRTGTRAKKSSAGYDLTRLLVGSEGTLGVMSEITVKLYPLPESVMAATCCFPTLADAVNTTIQIIQLGVPIARCELLDATTVRLVNQHSKLSLPESAMLLMEFHGSPAGVQEQVETVQAIAQEFGGAEFAWAATPEERTRLWTARHNAYFAGVQSVPGCKAITTDACVPISRLADALLASVDEAIAAGLPYFLVGHVGDGNFHMGYLIDPTQPAQRALAEQLNHQLVSRALALGGTCTGEHGVGLHKQGFLLAETGTGAVAMMRAVKQALDPLGILNPGKIFST